MRKSTQKKGAERKENANQTQLTDDTDRLYCLLSVGLIFLLLKPFIRFWALSHALERFFGVAGRNIAYIIIIAVFAFLLIASSVIVDRTLEKSSDVLPDWACKSLKSKVSEEALRMLNIKSENEDKQK